jgi:DNA polymerase I
MIPGAVAALVVTPEGPGPRHAALLLDGRCEVVPLDRAPDAVRALEARASPRWVWWAASDAAAPLVGAGTVLARAWDVAEAHRLLHGGWSATAGQCWAAAHGIPVGTVPAPPTGDLFEFAADSENTVAGRRVEVAAAASCCRWAVSRAACAHA